MDMGPEEGWDGKGSGSRLMNCANETLGSSEQCAMFWCSKSDEMQPFSLNSKPAYCISQRLSPYDQ
jgi:hypothetical protein